MEEYILK